MNPPEDYRAKLDDMLRKMMDWRKANPTKDVKIQFNFPSKVAVITGVSDGLKYHYITANEAGMELINALGPIGVPEEPTLLMLRVVLEACRQEEFETPGLVCPACQKTLEMASSISADSRAPKQGDLLICADCGVLLVLGLTALELLSHAAFEALPKNVQSGLRGCQAMLARERRKERLRA